MRPRWPLYLLLGLVGLSGSARGAGPTRLRIGLLSQVGFNSQLVQAQRLPENLVGPGNEALLLQVAPWVALESETGRITQIIRYRFIGDGYLLLRSSTPLYSYQNALSSLTRIDLTARLQWNLNLTATQGDVNTFAQAQDPSTREIVPFAARRTQFVTVLASSGLLWQPTARLRITQPISFRAYIPYGTIEIRGVDNEVIDNQNANRFFQSYLLDGGLGLDYEWPRAHLGAEGRVGWFRPQTGISPGGRDTSLLTGQLLVRTMIELAPRWRATANAGTFFAAPASSLHVLLLAPIGGAGLSYLFPRLEWILSLNYTHGAGGEVFLGRVMLGDMIALRLNIPLPRDVGLGASVAYRYAQTILAFGAPEAPGVITYGQTFHLVLADAGLGWRVRDGVSLMARYQYMRQMFVGAPLDTEPFQDFDGHRAMVGVALTYPTRDR